MAVAGDLPGAVLFACNRNAVRSPMAAAILHLAGSRVFVASAGVRAGEPTDPFAIAAMEELGIDMSKHKPVSLAGTTPPSTSSSRSRRKPITRRLRS